MEKLLPAIPAKRYFTIGEVSDLCGVKPYVLRYWEQEFSQLKPMKRRGNRRYYQHHEVLLIRRIRDLLYDQGFTISGARNQLGELVGGPRLAGQLEDQEAETGPSETQPAHEHALSSGNLDLGEFSVANQIDLAPSQLRAELLSIRALLTV